MAQIIFVYICFCMNNISNFHLIHQSIKTISYNLSVHGIFFIKKHFNKITYTRIMSYICVSVFI